MTIFICSIKTNTFVWRLKDLLRRAGRRQCSDRHAKRTTKSLSSYAEDKTKRILPLPMLRPDMKYPPPYVYVCMYVWIRRALIVGNFVNRDQSSICYGRAATKHTHRNHTIHISLRRVTVIRNPIENTI